MSARSTGSDSFDANDALPPSFAPSSGAASGTPSRTPSVPTSSAGHTHRASAGAPPSFTPANARRSPSNAPGHGSSTSCAAHGSAAHTEAHSSAAAPSPRDAMPQSFQPGSNRPSRRSTSVNRVPSNDASQGTRNDHSSARSHDHSRRQAGPSGASSTPRSPGSSSPSGSSSVTRPRRRHSVRRIVASIIVVLLAAVALLTFGTYSWVDHNLNRQPWTSDMDKGSATTWLILGSDERDGTTPDSNEGSRTDTMLVLIKPKSGPSALISIPRDTLVSIDGSYMKINAVYDVYGRQQLVHEVEDITGLRVDHVAMLSFGGLVKVIDALGGVELCYDQDVNDEKSGMNWVAGCHLTDGINALAFSRMRYSDPNSDFGRADRQRQVINAITKKAASTSTLLNPATVKKVGDAALDSVTVDEDTSPFTLLQMLLAFKSASSPQGISGTPYWTDPDYYVDGVGSSVLLDNARNRELFKQLGDGTHAAGKVGTLAEQQ